MKNWQKLKTDSSLRAKLLTRQKVINAIRSFFQSEGFLEVETPLLVKSPGTEPYLEVFETVLKTQNQEHRTAYLLTSPELSMKKLLSADIGSIFTICKSFRNSEGLSSFHNPEFTILEWYRVDADYQDVMQDCENLLHHIALQLIPDFAENQTMTYQNKQYDLSKPWERISVAEAFNKYSSVNIDELLDEQKLKAIAKNKGYQVTNKTTWEEAYNQILLNEIEPQLGVTAPTILYDYPASQAALSKKKQDDPRFAERFEFFLAGLELGNAFSELTDGSEQEDRMKADLAERKSLGKVEYEMDTDFISSLKGGIPETGGIAVGVDRLVMLFADASTLQETLFFPVTELFDFE